MWNTQINTKVGDPLNPNPEQQAVINTHEGEIALISGPGSGKTATLVARYESLIAAGARSSDILCTTFTKSAADEMQKRAGKGMFKTFHAYGLSILTAELGKAPIEPELRHRLLYGLCKRYKTDYKELAKYISKARHEGDYPNASYNYLRAYEAYEKERRAAGWIDFDSMIVDAVSLLEKPEVRARHQWKYIMADECQDTDDLQFRMLQLISEKYRNVMCVGDPGQCQPPNTKVRVLVHKNRGSIASNWTEKRIADLTCEDAVLSWTKHDDRVYLSPRKVVLASRPYRGKLLEITLANGCSTEVTPNHYVWTKFSKRVFQEQPSYVYLMWRKDLGFRVGTSHFRRKGECNQISQRGKQEKADKFWILDVVADTSEALTRESIYSLEYGIPQQIFHSYNKTIKTDLQIQRIFAVADPTNGLRCLADLGLLFTHPLIEWPKTTHMHGYFKTAAANIIPDYMEFPTTEQYKSSTVEIVTERDYEGAVYSLDVEKDHTYIADGIPVGNSIYMFRGAKPENLTDFTRWFPNGKTMYLGRNYRSTHEIVKFVRENYPIETPLKEKLQPHRTDKGVPIEYKIFQNPFDEAESAVVRANEVPLDSAILARTNRALGPIENFCIENEIKYTLLGKSGFWKQHEIVRTVERLKPYANLTLTAAFGLVMPAIETHYRAEDATPEDNYALENIRSLRDIGKRFTSCRDFVVFANKCQHAKKTTKGITIGTIHAAKGTEYKNVYLVDFRADMVPHIKGDPSEEKRIFFVGISRPKDRLRISWVGTPSPYLRRYLSEDVLLTLVENSAKVEKLKKQNTLFEA